LPRQGDRGQGGGGGMVPPFVAVIKRKKGEEKNLKEKKGLPKWTIVAGG